MRLTVIVPRIPPVVDGIGDYALSLARMLRDNVGITTRFIVADAAWTGPNQVEGFEVRRLESHSANELLSLLSGDPDIDPQVLLHYEGYAYANRGCPFWLVDAIEKWRRTSSNRSLVTMFHELYATGPPWTSSFWLSSLQKNLATRLARLSDQCFTSLECYAEAVHKMNGKATSKANSLPVFSSIGEPEAAPSLRERRRRLVVFGTRGRRIEVYKRSAADLNRISHKLGIEEIVDVGRSVDFDISRVVAVPVVVYGELPNSEVSELLLDSVAGVIDYPAAFLAKSTIFAAYCAHRVIPIVAKYPVSSPADGLLLNMHFWLADVSNDLLSLEAGQVIADHARVWYQTHGRSAHAARLTACLGGNAQPAEIR